MASKRRIRRSDCQGKRRYGDAETATGDARILARKERWRFNVYVCPFCRGYHVGHAPHTDPAERRF